MVKDCELQTALKAKQDTLRISLRDLAKMMRISDAYLVMFFSNKRKAGFPLLHGILAAFPEEKSWEPIIIQYLRENGKTKTPQAPIL
jgi:hypothetical protein